MNQRIRELVKEAGGEFWQRLENDVVNPEAFVTFDPPQSLEKFAQLIVRDCISQIALIGISNFENDDISWTVDFAIKNIKEKFGVTDENTNRSTQG